MSLVIYDTETTGTNTSFDQILQFAAIRTDPNLNEIDRFEIRSRLRPHIVPSPGAMHVTGITVAQLRDLSLPSHYEMVRKINAKLLSWSPAIFLGYNSIAFDEHLFRQALYQTLHRPYLTNTNGNARSDIMRMVQATSLFAPDILNIPFGDNGKPTFRLDRVAFANGYVHEHAHDALSDVKATLFLCRFLAERVPELWSAFMRFSQKAAVVDYIESEPVFCLSEFYYSNPYSWLVTAIGANSENSSEHYVYDLSVNPESLRTLTSEQLIWRLGISPKPIRRLRVNAAPLIMPAEEAPTISSSKAISLEEVFRRAQTLGSDSTLRKRLIDAFESAREKREPSLYIEEQIYECFFSRSDQNLLDEFHEVAWEHRLALIERFEDKRLKVLGLRLIYHEKPELLSDTLHAEHDKETFRHLIGDEEGSVPWLTIREALLQIDDLLASSEIQENSHLKEHRIYLLEMMERTRDFNH